MTYFLDKWASESPEYERMLAEEALILDVTEKVWELLESREMNKADLAKALGKSKAYVSQVLSGSRNMTLRTLADVADALGSSVKVVLRDKQAQSQWVEIGKLQVLTMEAPNGNITTPGDEHWSRPSKAIMPKYEVDAA